MIGGGAFGNTQNYRRHELRGTLGPACFDAGKSSHAAKVGGGYEFTEEQFNRVANGRGTIVNVTQNGVPALRARYFTFRPPSAARGVHPRCSPRTTSAWEPACSSTASSS